MRNFNIGSQKKNKSNLIKYLVFLNVSMGTLMATISGGIVNVILPSVVEEYEVLLTSAQWIVSVYFLAIASLLPVFGKISDMLGRSRVYFVGLLVFTVFTFACSLAPSLAMLIVFRCIQGIGAALIMANNIALISSSFPLSERGRALGISNTIVAAGTLIGPGLGGIFLEYLGWNSVFLIPVPFGIVGLILSIKLLKHDNSETKKIEGFDYLGACLLSAGTLGIVFALINGDNWNWNSQIITIILISIILLYLFIRNEKKHSNPIIHIEIFKNHVFVYGIVANFLFFVSMIMVMIITPFYLSDVLNYSGTEIGFMLMAIPFGMIFTAPLAGYLFDKFKLMQLTTIGLIISMISALSLVFIDANSSKTILFLQLLMMGIGRGFFQSPNNSIVMNSVSKNELSLAGSLLAFIRNFGQVTGTTLAVIIFTTLMGQYSNTQDLVYYDKYLSSISYVYWAAFFTLILAVLISIIRGKNALLVRQGEIRLNYMKS